MCHVAETIDFLICHEKRTYFRLLSRHKCHSYDERVRRIEPSFIGVIEPSFVGMIEPSFVGMIEPSFVGAST